MSYAIVYVTGASEWTVGTVLGCYEVDWEFAMAIADNRRLPNPKAGVDFQFAETQGIIVRIEDAPRVVGSTRVIEEYEDLKEGDWE